jgi:hypothetical protein
VRQPAFRDALGFALVRFALARPLFVADFVAVRFELLADFVTRVLLDAAGLAFALAFGEARFFAGDVFAFDGRLVDLGTERLLRAPITAPDTAPIRVPTTGVPTAVPTTAPATAPPKVLLAAPFSSFDRSSFLSSSVISTSLVLISMVTAERSRNATDKGADKKRQR